MHCGSLRLICIPITSFNLSSDTDLQPVGLWFLCVTISAEVLSNLDGDALSEQAARGKPSLDTSKNPEAIGQWQQNGESDSSQTQCW